jgi:Glycosyl transferase family 2
MSDRCAVSIVVNNYNYGRFLPEAINSALEQTYPHTEVVVVDDGSTDESREVIGRYAGKVVAVLKGNGGQASAFNAGFAACRGDVVLFLDADDLLLPTAAERALQAFRSPDVVKVHWPLWVIDEQGRRTGAVHPDAPLPEGRLLDAVLRTGPASYLSPPTSGNAWSREFLEEVVPVRDSGDKHGADAYLFTLAPLYGAFRTVADPLGCYRLHPACYSGIGGLRFQMERDLLRHEHHCCVFQEHLRRRGIEADPQLWKGTGTSYRWLQDMLALPEEIAELVPAGDSFVLVDEGQLGDGWVPGRRAVPFLERDGRYWGPPPDDATAVSELRRLHRAGAEHVVFISPTFWWLDHYTGLHRFLRAHATDVRENSRLVAFRLPSPETHSAYQRSCDE